MANTIKPIETEYNGYRFRSRLEARWAVFFDAAGIRYEYEPEGFELGDGVRYLPDFYLPEFEIYVEIKPFVKGMRVVNYGASNEWEEKCERFRDKTDKAILMCYGDPSEDLNKKLFAYEANDNGGGIYSGWANFVTISHSGKVVLWVDYPDPHGTVFVSQWKDNENVLTTHDLAEREWYSQVIHDVNALVYRCLWFDPSSDDVLNSAKKKARQARFEFGETPVVTHG